MTSKTLALIGHSGAGKSSCLLALGLDRNWADMDVVFQHRELSIDVALEWLSAEEQGQPLKVVSNHERMLASMQGAKSSGQYPERFSRIWFVYLRKPKDQLEQHLRLPTAGGRNRMPTDQRYTIDKYDELDRLFRNLADQVIDCSNSSVSQVAREVNVLVQTFQK